MARTMWVKDIVKTTNGIHYIPGNWREMTSQKKQYDTIWSESTQAERLLKEMDNGSGWIEAPICIDMGSASCSFLEPFTSSEEAFQWMEENQDNIYFVKQTCPELRKKFPQIPIQASWGEVEKAMGE